MHIRRRRKGDEKEKKRAEREGENNARAKIYRGSTGVNLFLPGSRHRSRLFPTIIYIISRDNESRRKRRPVTRTQNCNARAFPFGKNNRAFVRRLCRVAIKGGIVGLHGGKAGRGCDASRRGSVRPTTQQTASRCTKIGPFSLKLRLSRGWRDS